MDEKTGTKAATSALIVSLVSTAVSVGALVVTVRQTLETHRYNTIAIRPALNFVYDTDQRTTKTPGLWIANTGLGPAAIKSFTIYVDKEPLKGWDDLDRFIKFKSEPITMIYDPGDVVNKGDKDLLFGPPPKEKAELKRYLDFVDERLAVQVTYCSLDDICETRCSAPAMCGEPSKK